MMDRHDEMSAGVIGHLHGLFRNASGQCTNRGELSSLTGTKSVTLGTYLRGRTIPPLQKC
jgi:hypothetical protein